MSTGWMSTSEPAAVAQGQEELALYRDWIAKASEVCRRAATGDLESRLLHIPTEGDLGVLLRSINHLLDLTDAFVRESRATLEHAAEGKFYRRVLLNGMRGTFGQTSQTINDATARMADQARQISESDRRRRDLANELANVINTLASTATEMHATAKSLSALAKQSMGESADAATSAAQTSSSVDHVADTSKRVRNAFESVAHQTDQCKSIAEAAVDSVADADPVMESLTQAAERIGGIVRLVSGVAHQSNLLALNATIEAARSGEAGRGFAVVAAEVKELARKTAGATEEIAVEIRRSQDATVQMSAALNRICERIDKISGISAEIAGNVKQQTSSITDISQHAAAAAEGARSVSLRVSTVSDVAVQTAQWAEQLVQAADVLSREGESLRGQVQGLLEGL